MLTDHPFPSTSLGAVLVWQGGSLWLGRHQGTTAEHAHHAIQITLALEDSVDFATAGADDWTSYTGAMVPPHLKHTLRSGGVWSATIFVEPESPAGRILLERFGRLTIRALPHQLTEASADLLRGALWRHGSEEDLRDAAWHVIAQLTAGSRPRSVVDVRVLTAIEVMRERLHRSLTLAEVAREVHLSPSRFRHLFVEETGIAFRPYVLWLRLQRALEVYVQGGRLTDAALDAGFSDVAHLSRTFRRMFGVKPASLIRDGARARGG